MGGLLNFTPISPLRDSIPQRAADLPAASSFGLMQNGVRFGQGVAPVCKAMLVRSLECTIVSGAEMERTGLATRSSKLILGDKTATHFNSM
jgi:hypothetical protein